jgi:hypothetical protein
MLWFEYGSSPPKLRLRVGCQHNSVKKWWNLYKVIRSRELHLHEGINVVPVRMG